jgi:hypothetical protein
MTLSTLICTKCSSPVAVSGRGVVLPFVCDECDFNFTQEYSDMAPKKTSTKEVTPTPCEAGTCDCVPESKVYPPSAEGEPGCDTASIENTTALIADLELQLEAERQTIVADEAKIAELEMQLIEAKDDYAAVKAEKDLSCVMGIITVNAAKATLAQKDEEIGTLRQAVVAAEESEAKAFRFSRFALRQRDRSEIRAEFAKELLLALYAERG